MTGTSRSLELRAELTTLQLRFLPSEAALRKRAVAQLMAKALYLCQSESDGGRGFSAAEMAAAIRQLLSEPVAMSSDQAEEACRFLESTGTIEPRGSGFRLTPNASDSLAKELDAHASRLHNTLRNRFPDSIPESQLAPWFSAACARFFALYGTETARAVTGGILNRPDPESLRRVIVQTAREHGLESRADELRSGFEAYISQPTIGEQTHIWSCWQAMFAARLIASERGPDPITVERFRDAVVYLDTNVLVRFATDIQRLARGVSVLGRAMDGLGISLRLMPQTEEEYRGLVGAKKLQLTALIPAFHRDVIKRARDEFGKAAMFRIEVRHESLDEFFDAIGEPPSSMAGTIQINAEAESAVLQAAQLATKDRRLLAAIFEASTKRMLGPKKPHVVEHDAALTGAVEHLFAQRTEAWILTEDTTMPPVSAARAGAGQLSRWLTLEAFILVLGLDAGGPTLKPSDFGDLLSAMIRNDLHPGPDTYSLDDLAGLISMEAGVMELDDNEVIELAETVAAARLRGARAGDEELALAVQRAYNKSRRRHIELDTDSRAEAAQLRAELQREREASAAAIHELTPLKVRTLKGEARGRFLKWLAWSLPLSVVTTLVAILVIVAIARTADLHPVVAYTAAIVLAPAACTSALFIPELFRRIARLRAETSAAESTVPRTAGSK